MSKQSRSISERFWQKVIRSDNCWDWKGFKDKDGYGRLAKNGYSSGMLLAHRVSWEIHYGPIPEGLCVLHACDNPPCTNPDHLFLGTIKDNNIDCINKRRRAKGSKVSSSILTESQVVEIRLYLAQGVASRVIGKYFNVSRSCIGDINTKRTWGWMGESSACVSA